MITLLYLPTGWVLAGAIDDAGLGLASVVLSSSASVVLLVDIVTSGDIDLGDYAYGRDEMLFLAGQAPRAGAAN